jgi:hypothetical protein
MNTAIVELDPFSQVLAREVYANYQAELRKLADNSGKKLDGRSQQPSRALTSSGRQGHLGACHTEASRPRFSRRSYIRTISNPSIFRN